MDRLPARDGDLTVNDRAFGDSYAASDNVGTNDCRCTNLQLPLDHESAG
jgi:hypothetical protein